MDILMIYLCIINAAGLLLMLIDKRKAVKKVWRIPEATLLTIAVIGGSLGTLLGMRLFRHKTKHVKFSVGIPLMLVLHILLALLLFCFIS